jgi:hypothetical protein
MIYLKLETPPTTFMDVLNVLYDNKTEAYKSSAPTFHDEDFTSVECMSNKRRSFQALFEIARTYFPTITVEEFLKCLMKRCMRFHVCYDIKKIVFISSMVGTNFKEEFMDYKNLIAHLEKHPPDSDSKYPAIIEELKQFCDDIS